MQGRVPSICATTQAPVQRDRPTVSDCLCVIMLGLRACYYDEVRVHTRNAHHMYVLCVWRLRTVWSTRTPMQMLLIAYLRVSNRMHSAHGMYA